MQRKCNHEPLCDCNDCTPNGIQFEARKKDDDFDVKEGFRSYQKAYLGAMEMTLGEEGAKTPLADMYRANLTRYAICRAMTTEDLYREARDWTERASLDQLMKYWVQTETNTIRSRVRTGKDFERFMSGEDMRLFPNIKWQMTISKDPRQSHLKLAGQIFSKEEVLELGIAPGTEWNCKCSWAQTARKATISLKDMGIKVPQGLEGIASRTGEIFTQRANAVRKVMQSREKYRRAAEYFRFDHQEPTLRINAMADKRDLLDNLNTGRQLAKSGYRVEIRPHYIEEGVKNPELDIDGKIADVKRIESEKGVPNAFRKCIEQGGSVVVINTNKMPSVNLVRLHRRIQMRRSDFEDGFIEKCIVVVKNRVYEITADSLDEPIGEQ